MQNYLVKVSYDGTKYRGFQRLKQGETIQNKIEILLEKQLGMPIGITGAGRTDKGVHAKGQYFNFKVKNPLDEGEFLENCNQYLPEDIRFLKMIPVHDRFHARHSAGNKWYRYYVWNEKIADPFLRKTSWHIPETLSLTEMNKAAEILEGTHDFRCFTNMKNQKKSTIKTVDSISIHRQDTGELILDYIGSGFLMHMVRIMTGTLVEVGRGERKKESILELLDGANRWESGILAPSHGLFLMDVFYEELRGK